MPPNLPNMSQFSKPPDEEEGFISSMENTQTVNQLRSSAGLLFCEIISTFLKYLTCQIPVGFIACQILVRFTGQEFENVRKVTGRAAHSSGSHIPMHFILLARYVRILYRFMISSRPFSECHGTYPARAVKHFKQLTILNNRSLN